MQSAEFRNPVSFVQRGKVICVRFGSFMYNNSVKGTRRICYKQVPETVILWYTKY